MWAKQCKNVEIYQNRIVSQLKGIFGKRRVKSEWSVAKGSRDAWTRDLYCPIIDIAVGPFNTKRNVYVDREKINRAYLKYKYFAEKLQNATGTKIDDECLNANPRCLFAIEIENETDAKAMLGSIVNAAAVGKIGIMVAFNRKSYSYLIKLRKYLRFIKDVHKVQEDISKNVIIISKNEFAAILERSRISDISNSA
jgi:hypothetical protein